MFKEAFKYYKSKNPPPELKNVIDFNNIDDFAFKIKKIDVKCETTSKLHGLKPVPTWEVYEVLEHPGLIFIRNPFTSIGQRYWVTRCIQDYSKKPNKSNLDALNLVPENKEWWDICQNNNNIMLLDKLRWITLGYHHNWDTKIYSEDSKSEFPKDLGDLTAFIANILGYNNYKAEAAIINYYHMDSTLSGHTDHSEKDLEAPLFSFSFGQTAIFMIGGKAKEDEATPIFLRSGDICIMSKESRLCYHGVPKILQIDSRFWDDFDETETMSVPKEYKSVLSLCKDDISWKPFDNYLGHSRININVRQVLNRGEKRLSDENEENVT